MQSLTCNFRQKNLIIKSLMNFSFSSCGYYHTGLLSEDGRLFLFGNNTDRQLGRSKSDQNNDPLEVSLPDRVNAVACGHQHTVVLTEEGEVYTCGMI
jgi:X-linked retinitis pigmentosa GTPase regulator